MVAAISSPSTSRPILTLKIIHHRDAEAQRKINKSYLAGFLGARGY
jgi:hypothetical protein